MTYIIAPCILPGMACAIHGVTCQDGASCPGFLRRHFADIVAEHEAAQLDAAPPVPPSDAPPSDAPPSDAPPSDAPPSDAPPSDESAHVEVEPIPAPAHLLFHDDVMRHIDELHRDHRAANPTTPAAILDAFVEALRNRLA